MAREEFGDTVDDAGCIDSKESQSILNFVNHRNSRLALEIFHDIEEPIIHIGLIGKLHLDLIKVTESILFIGVSTSTSTISTAKICTHIQDRLLSTLSQRRRTGNLMRLRDGRPKWDLLQSRGCFLLLLLERIAERGPWTARDAMRSVGGRGMVAEEARTKRLMLLKLGSGGLGIVLDGPVRIAV